MPVPSVPGAPAARRHLVALLLTLLGASPAAAEETIFDPENPAIQEEEEAEQESGEETIFDPENPSVEAAEAAEATPPDTLDEPAGLEAATFLGGYASTLAVDSAFDEGTEDIVESWSALDLRLEYDPSPTTSVVVEAEFRHWLAGKAHPGETDLLLNATEIRADYDARLGEAWVLWRSGPWSLAAGNLITSWGATDLIRPGDVVNPVDLTTIDVTGSLEKIPQLTVDLAYIGDAWSASALLVPFFVPNRQWLFGRDTAFLGPVNPIATSQFPISPLLDRLIDRSIQDDVQPVLLATSVPDEVPENLSVGARVATTVWNTDLGLSWLYGWDRTPRLELDEDLGALIRTALDDALVLADLDLAAFFGRNPEALALSQRLAEKALAGEELYGSTYDRQQMLLAEGARYIGPIGVRADAAFFSEKTYYDASLRGVRHPTFSGALGLSYERLRAEDDQLVLTVEGFYTRPFTDDELLLVGDGAWGVAGAFTFTPPWAGATLQVGGLSNLHTGDLLASASVARRWRSWLRTTLAYTLFEGPDPREELTIGGLYDRNDYLALKVDGVF